MENSVFNADINMKIHQTNLDLAKKNLDISQSMLKAFTTLIEIFSNLSVTNIPKIVKDIAGLSNPIISAAEKAIEANIQQIQAVKQLTDIQSTIQLPELSKVNPLKNISKPDLINQSLSGV